MSPDWFDDICPLVKEGARTVVEQHLDGTDLPTRSFHRLATGGLLQSTQEFSVTAPGALLEDAETFDDLYEGEFAEAARYIDSKLPDPPAGSNLSETDRLQSIERGLFEFVGVVLNYTGILQFDETAFDAAFNEQFEPRFTDREHSRFLLCLKNTTIEPGITIDLDETSTADSPKYLGPYAVETRRIRPLDELEETGIATYESPTTGVLEAVGPLDSQQPNAALEIVLRRRRPYAEIARDIDGTDINPWRGSEFDVTPVDVYPWQQLTEVIEYLATGIRRCLRLLCPKGTVGYEKGYHVIPGWETYRGLATPVTFGMDFECPSATTRTHLTEDRALEISQFWSEHFGQLAPGHEKFQNPLARFERMFSRESLEDQLVDCVIGCETTVLKGGTQGGNKYRLGVRSAALLGDQNSLEWSSAMVGEFLRTLYDNRNDIIHDDETLPNGPSDGLITVEGEDFTGEGLLVRARELYADILQEYLDLVPGCEPDIDGINERIDSAVLHQGDEIRDRLF